MRVLLDTNILVRANAKSELIFAGPAPRVVPSDPDDDPIVHASLQIDFPSNNPRVARHITI